MKLRVSLVFQLQSHNQVNHLFFSLSGPTPLPILSNLYHIFKADKIIFLAFHKLSLKFGPVYTLFLGPKKHVVVSGVSELKELMHNPAFDDRTWPSNKRIVDEIYSGQTKKENPSKQTEHHLPNPVS